MIKILIVCTANICRSPMGEAILQNLVEKDGLEEVIEISSGGILGIEGERASDFSIAVAKEKGLNLESHRSQGVTSDVINASDLVLCMTIDQAEKLKYMYATCHNKIYTLREYLMEDELFFYSIDDPIGLSLEFYRKIFNDIEKEMKRIYPAIKEKAQTQDNHT